ncbi:MAG: hypothetical protein V3S51_07285 [Dehalococcoidia bacterium]
MKKVLPSRELHRMKPVLPAPRPYVCAKCLQGGGTLIKNANGLMVHQDCGVKTASSWKVRKLMKQGKLFLPRSKGVK